MTWLPIATAPKDGTWIVTIIDMPGCHPAVVSWQTHFGHSRWAGDPEIHEHEGCWKECFLMSRYDPTHWQPLLVPPCSALPSPPEAP